MAVSVAKLPTSNELPPSNESLSKTAEPAEVNINADAKLLKRSGSVPRLSPWDDIVPNAAFSLRRLKYLLNKIPTEGKIAIGFKNYTDYDLKLINVFYEYGSGPKSSPKFIPSQYAGLFSARKQDEKDVGSVGVLSYYIEDARKTVHVMWAVRSWSYASSSNTWNVFVEDGYKEPTFRLLERMYDGDDIYPHPNSPDYWHARRFDGFLLEGIMTNRGQALLEVELRDPEDTLASDPLVGPNEG